MQLTPRMQAVQSPIIPVVGELMRQHPGTLSLGQGVVYYGPPAQAMAEVAAFGQDIMQHRYQPVQGIPPLLEAIAHKLQRDNQITITPTNADTQAGNCIVVTAGSNMGFINALLAIASPGDEIILQTPYYFNHEMAIAIASCHAVLVPTDENYQLQPDKIRQAITPRTRAIVTISPNNPCGVIYPEAMLREVNQICREYGLYHISDEAYDYFTYEDMTAFSPGAIAGSENHTISLFSLSKAYGFASWRIGYMVLPRHLLTSVKKIQDTILICPPVVSQYAALGALQAGVEYVRQKQGAIAQMRQIVLEQLVGVGDRCTVSQAQGAFYVLLKLDTHLDAETVMERLICDHGVAVIPGTTFGLHEGCYLRIAYGALQPGTVAEAIGRLVSGLRQIL